MFLPEAGVAGLQSAYRVNEFREIRDTVSQNAEEGNRDRYCSVHTNSELELYCETCMELICFRCAYIGSQHHDHDHQDIDGAFRWYDEHLRPRQREELSSLHNMLTRVLASLKEAMQENGLVGERRTTLNNITAEVRAADNEVVAISDLCGNQLDQIRALHTRNEVSGRVMAVTTTMNSSLLKLRAPDPSLCRVTGNIALALTGERSTVTLTAIDYMRKACKVPITTLECQCAGGKVDPKILRSGENRYIISYQPTTTPQLRLSVTIQGKHVRGSPFNIAVRPPAEKIGSPFTYPLSGSQGLCRLASKGLHEVVVSEQGKDEVSLFNAFGSKRHSFGSYGCEEGQFDSPCGVTVDGMGNILVADCGNHRIQKFTAKGTFMTSVGSLGSGELQFYCPSDVAFNMTNNKVYVVDKNNHVQILNSGLVFKRTFWNTYTLRVIDSDLTFHSIFGSLGDGQGEFNDPQGIACDSTGKVYVADSGNHRVQVFTAEGRFLSKFGVLGMGNETVEYPISITIDTSDRLYVGECGRISVLTPQGECVRSLTPSKGEYAACGLAVNRIGVLFASDGERVQVVIKGPLNFHVLLVVTCFIAFLFALLFSKCT
jgi:sugar lactone lactonase YvrE